MTFVDVVILIVLLVSAGIGLSRGFAREIVGLIGLVLGVGLGLLFAPGLAGSVFSWLPGPLALGGAFLTVFLLTLIAATLVGKLLTAVINAASLSIPNRILGALFGVARAALIILISLVTIDLLGVEASPWLEPSRLGRPAWSLAREVRDLLPGGRPVAHPAPTGPRKTTDI